MNFIWTSEAIGFKLSNKEQIRSMVNMFIPNANNVMFACGSQNVLYAQASSSLTFRVNTSKISSNEETI